MNRNSWKIAACSTLAFGLFTGAANAAGKLSYGSRVGMEVTILDTHGLDTKNAVILTKHTREDATKFCREYARSVTSKCIDDELKRPLKDGVRADCTSGGFFDFRGNEWRFMGKNKSPSEFGAKYKLVFLKTQQVADGSGASDYGVAMGIFQALCPRTAPTDD